MTPAQKKQEQLRRLLSGPIPDGVRNGSVQNAIRFKEWAGKAARAAHSAAPNLAAIDSLIAQRLDMR